VVEFGILGSLWVAVDKREVELRGAKKRGLVARLLLDANRVVSLERLVADLWPEGSHGAQATVRTYVSRLRNALGRDRLMARSHGYLIVVEDDELDARRFESLLARARHANVTAEKAVDLLEAAERLWRGPAFAEFADAAWAQAAAERLNRRRLDATIHRLEAGLHCGRCHDTAAEAEALVRRVPLDERLWELLVLGQYLSGRQADALRSYQRARAILVEQVGTEPTPRLRSLERRILDQDPWLDQQAAASARPPAGQHWVPGDSAGSARGTASDVREADEPTITIPFPPVVAASRRGAFVGRAAEAERLAQAWIRARGGERQVHLIGGEPGIGKTRLAAELAAAAHDDGAVVLWGRCDEGLGVAYQPLIEALEHYTRHCPDEALATRLGDRTARLARLVPEIRARETAQRIPADDPETERLHLFGAVSDFLGEIARPNGLVLILDDVHWADTAMLLLLRRLARPSADPTLLIAAYRDTEPAASQQFAPVLADLHREPTVSRSNLRGLDETSIAGLLATATSGAQDAVGRDVVRAVHAKTEGNPFYAGQILGHLVETGALRREGHQWIPTIPVDRLAIPDVVRDVVERRLARLPGPAQHALTVAAVVGREFAVTALEQLLPDSGGSDEFLTALEQALRARLIQEAHGQVGRLSFVHDLVRQTLYESLSTTRRARLHRRVGETLATLPRAEAQPAAIARHLVAGVAAGGRDEAILWCERAGTKATQQYAFEEAVTQFERALELVEGDANPDRAVSARLYRASAQAKGWAMDIAGAKTAAARACEDAKAIGSFELLADAAIAYARWDRAGIPDETSAHLLQLALEEVGERDAGLRASLLATLAFHRAINRGRGITADVIAREALALARTVGDHRILAEVLGCRSWVLLGSPDIALQEAVLSELASLVDEAPFWRSWVDLLTGVVRLRTGDLAAFHVQQERIAEHCTGGRNRFLEAVTAIWRASLALLDGRFDEAEDHVRDIHRLAVHDANIAASHVALLFYLRRDQGRLDEFRPLLRAAIDQAPGLASLRAGLALLHLELDELDDARELYESLVEVLDDPAPGIDHSVIVTALTDVCLRLGDTRRVPTLERALEPYSGQLLVVGLGAACLGAADRYLGMLAAADGRRADSEMHLNAALQFERSVGSAPLVARTHIARAQALLQSGEANDEAVATCLLRTAAGTARTLSMNGLTREIDTLVRP
jgi:DNA-binding SARP family transcriptional activator/tetratricopeptide (TPR) repeat protein